MNSFKHLLVNIHRCAAENIPKLALTMMIMGLISYAALGAASAPLGAALASGAVNPAVFAAALFSGFAVTLLNNILLYGFFVMVLLMYKKERAVLGHLFSGFRDFSRALKTALFFVALYMLIIFAAGALLYVTAADFFTRHTELLFAALLILSLCVLAFIYLQFAFTWFFLYEDSKLSVGQALRKSSALMKKKRFDFFLLCVQSGGLYLLFALLSFIFPAIMGQRGGAVSAFALSLVRVLSTLSLYISLIRISIAFAAAYEAVKPGQDTETGRTKSAYKEISAPADTAASSADTQSDSADTKSDSAHKIRG